MTAARLKLTLALLTTGALALGGCGGNVDFNAPPPSPSPHALAQIRSVVERFGSAMATGNGPAGCALLDASAQQQIAGELTEGQPTNSSTLTLCEQAIAAVAGQLSASQRAVLSSLQVGEVSVEQQTAAIDPSQITSTAGAVALSHSADASSSSVGLVEQGGQWLIDSVD
jgi:hypothetical protein